MRWLLAVVFVAACSSPSSPAPCNPTQVVTGGGTVSLHGTAYDVTTAQTEDFLNSGSLTVTAGEADAGMGALMAGDPVVAVTLMMPPPDDPGTYTLASLGAKAAYCGASAKLTADASGTLTGCIEANGAKTSYTTATLDGSVVVDSARKKSLDATGDVEIHVAYGAGETTCQ
ncbi:MAG TPA: hypothetical protein VIF62_03665 [Labilithrix sp.]